MGSDAQWRCRHMVVQEVAWDMLGYKQDSPTPIAQDNNACIFLVKGSGMYNRAKHIDTRIYRIREKSESGQVKLYKVAGENQPADIFTKSLPRSSDDL
jgi:hypothetical protein